MSRGLFALLVVLAFGFGFMHYGGWPCLALYLGTLLVDLFFNYTAVKS